MLFGLGKCLICLIADVNVVIGIQLPMETLHSLVGRLCPEYKAVPHCHSRINNKSEVTASDHFQRIRFCGFGDGLSPGAGN
jgi:hypothetical protein